LCFARGFGEGFDSVGGLVLDFGLGFVLGFVLGFGVEFVDFGGVSF
jgi:uncharacterized membrane protein (Fun14 family)